MPWLRIRLFVEAVLYRYRAGIPWRDLPARFGNWKNVHRRLRCWCESGVIKRIFRYLAADHDNEYMMIDSTIVRAHQHSAGPSKKGDGSGHRTTPGQTEHKDPRHLRRSRQPGVTRYHTGTGCGYQPGGSNAGKHQSGCFPRCSAVRFNHHPV